MPIYQITIIVQSAQLSLKTLAKSLMAALRAQTGLPLFTMPDLEPDQEPVQIEQRRGDLYFCCPVSCPGSAELNPRLQSLCTGLQAQLYPDGPELNIAGFAEPYPLSMPLELVLQGPAQLYGIYGSGAVYALNGHEKLEELEDPESPFFQDGTLRKLDAVESHQVLNSRHFTHVWSRHGSHNRTNPGPKSGANWLIRQA